MTTFTRPKIDTPESAADLIEAELATGCLNENVLAPGYPVEQALRVLIAVARRGITAPNDDPPVLHPAFQDVMDAVSALTIRREGTDHV